MSSKTLDSCGRSVRCFICGEVYYADDGFLTTTDDERTYSVCSPACLLELTTAPTFLDEEESKDQ